MARHKVVKTKSAKTNPSPGTSSSPVSGEVASLGEPEGVPGRFYSLPSALRLSTVDCTLAADSLMPASSTSVRVTSADRS